MSNYEDMKKEELLEEARNREGLSGYSDKNKDELVQMLKDHDANQSNQDSDSSSSNETQPDAGQEYLEKEKSKIADSDDETVDPEAEVRAGHHDPASDLDNPDVRGNLGESGQEAADKMDELGQSVLKDEANAAYDASGPLNLQSPEQRVMTGAVSEKNAEEQRKLLEENMGEEGHPGNFTEAGQPLSTGLYDEQDVARLKGDVKDNLGEDDDREVYEVRQEHVIDFPPPLAEREGTSSRSQDRAEDREEERNPDMAYAEPGGAPLGNPVIGAGSRLGDVFSQKGQFYTDGLSGGADHNLERAYELPEVLQSNNPEVRKAGDESLSEAAKKAKEENLSDHAKEQEQRVKSGEQQEAERQSFDEQADQQAEQSGQEQGDSSSEQ